MGGSDPRPDGTDGVRHGLLLAAIPAAFVAAYLVATAVVTGRLPALIAASLASGLLVLGALFVDPPVEFSN